MSDWNSINEMADDHFFSQEEVAGVTEDLSPKFAKTSPQFGAFSKGSSAWGDATRHEWRSEQRNWKSQRASQYK